MAGQGSKGGGAVVPATNAAQSGAAPSPLTADGTYFKDGVEYKPQLGFGGAAGIPVNQANQSPAPSGGFNINQAAATGLQNAMGATQAAVAAPLNVGAYMNPYQQEVIDRTQADIERQRQMAMNTMGAQATRANAFGGSRQGVAEGVTNAEYGRMAANAIAPMRMQGYNTAMTQAMNDRSARLGAASQLGSMAGQAFNTGRAINQDMMAQGLMQQGLQQQLIDAARGDFARYANSPLDSLNAPLSALGVAQRNGAQTQTTTQNPGILGTIGALKYMGIPIF